MPETIRIPVALAARHGLPALVEMSRGKRVILTSRGRPVAVIDSAERLDEEIQRMHEAASAVLEAATNLVAGRSEAFDLDAVCQKLGLDAARVRGRAAGHHDAAEDRPRPPDPR